MPLDETYRLYSAPAKRIKVDRKELPKPGDTLKKLQEQRRKPGTPSEKKLSKQFKTKPDAKKSDLETESLLPESSLLAASTPSFASVAAPASVNELARALKYDVDLIYEWVYSNVDFFPIFGSHKGAFGTMIDRAGNSFDQASLMVALLRASGYTANFVFGSIRLEKAEVEQFLGTQDTTVPAASSNVLTEGLIPNTPEYDGGGELEYIDFDHMWVSVRIDGINYVFDPSYKTYEYITGIDVAVAVDFNESTLITDAESGATIGANYIENLNKANIDSLFSGYANNLLTEIQTNNFDASTADIIGGRRIQPLSSQPVRQLELPYLTPGIEPSILEAIPDELRTWIEVAPFNEFFYIIDVIQFTDEVYGRRLTLSFNDDMITQLRLDGDLLAEASSPEDFGATLGVYLEVQHPFGDQIWDQFIKVGGTYVIGNSYGPVSQSMADYHQQVLAQNTSDGGSGNSESVLGASLQVLWSKYVSQRSKFDDILSQLSTTTIINYHFVGICGYSEQQQSPYFDLQGISTGVASRLGDEDTANSTFAALSFYVNGLEAGILQQTYPVVGVNTQRMLEVANGLGQKIYDANDTNWYGSGGIREDLVNWSSGLLDVLDDQIDVPSRLILHEDGETAVGDYVGSGWIQAIDTAFGGWISGNILGGATRVPVNTSQTNAGAFDSPDSFELSKGQQNKTTDPVSLFSGACYYDRNDFSVGSGPFPYSLQFSRSYDSNNRFVDGPLGYGWTHNFATSLATSSNAMRALGETSPKEAASAIAYCYVLLQLELSDASSLTKLLIAAFSSIWQMDQMTNNAVVISDSANGKTFVKMADGTYNPPLGFTDVLVQNMDDTFTMKSPQQLEWNFDIDGKLDTYVDPAGVTVSFTYNGSDQLESVSNGLERTINFAYTDGRLTTVSDDNSREVTFDFDILGHLVEFTDSEEESITYGYAERGLLSQVFLPANPTVAVMTNTYNSVGQVKSQSGSNTGTTEYFFAGSRTEEVDPLGNRHIMYYNSFGTLLRDINALDQETSFELDGLNRLLKTTYPEENSTELTYDNKNNVLTITSIPKPGSGLSNIVQTWTFENSGEEWNKPDTFTDGNGNTTSFEYDPDQGTLLTITRPEVDSETPVVEFTYNGRGQVLTRTDETGIVDTSVYDGANETLLSISRDSAGLNLLTAFGYDDVGNVNSVTDPNGNETTFEFDNERRLTQQTDPAPFGFITSWEYNANGWRTTLKRETGIPATPFQIWTWQYQANGSVSSIVDPANNATTFEYDTNNRLTKRTDAQGRAWQYSYDQLSRISTVTDPMNVVSETRNYTTNGMLNSIEDANANVTNLEYNGFDRLNKRIYPDATFEQNEVYDNNGNVLTFVTRNDEDIISTFDPLNRLKTRTPGALPEQTMTYDLAGRLLNINTPVSGGDPTTGDYGFDYDSAGRLIEQSMPDAKTVGYELDDNGNRTKLTYPDGYYVEYFYDELNRLTDIKLNGSGTAAIHFDFDDLSRRTLVTYENGCTCSYSWEMNDDMATLNHEFDNDSVDFAFSYNKVHQVTAMSASNKKFVWTPAASKTTIYSTANSLNQYPGVGGTGYSYNDNGCLTGGPLTSAAFDVLNRLTQASKGGITNDYWNDPLNRQGQKAIDSVKTGFLYDGQQLIEEYGDSGDLAYRYIRGNRLDEIFIRIAGATKTYFHHDRLGSVIAVTDDGGAVLSNYVYSPFGETSSLSGTPFGFTGQRYDEEMGLYYYRARIYSPAIGRFLQPDPIGFATGDLNLYAYVLNDPLNLLDALGLAATCPKWAKVTGTDARAEAFRNALNKLDALAQNPQQFPALHKVVEYFKTHPVNVTPQTGADKWGNYFSSELGKISGDPTVKLKGTGLFSNDLNNRQVIQIEMSALESIAHELGHAFELANPKVVLPGDPPNTFNFVKDIPMPIERDAFILQNEIRRSEDHAPRRGYGTGGPA